MPLGTFDRNENLAQLGSGTFDVLVVGGGITGVGVALTPLLTRPLRAPGLLGRQAAEAGEPAEREPRAPMARVQSPSQYAIPDRALPRQTSIGSSTASSPPRTQGWVSAWSSASRSSSAMAAISPRRTIRTAALSSGSRFRRGASTRTSPHQRAAIVFHCRRVQARQKLASCPRAAIGRPISKCRSICFWGGRT